MAGIRLVKIGLLHNDFSLLVQTDKHLLKFFCLLQESHQSFVRLCVFGSFLTGSDLSLKSAQIVGQLPDTVIEVSKLCHNACDDHCCLVASGIQGVPTLLQDCQLFPDNFLVNITSISQSDST